VPQIGVPVAAGSGERATTSNRLDQSQKIERMTAPALIVAAIMPPPIRCQAAKLKRFVNCYHQELLHKYC
jgi:hypothetical protein